MALVGYFDEFLVVRGDQLTGNITVDLLNSSSYLLNFPVGWREITNLTERYQSSSGILTFVDNLGFLYGSQEGVGCEDQDMTVITTHKITLTVRNVAQPALQDICFHYPGEEEQQSICFPGPSLKPNNCSTFVSTFFSLEEEMEVIFPTTNKNILVNEKERMVNPYLIGLKIDNRSIELDEKLIQIEFQHETMEVPCDHRILNHF